MTRELDDLRSMRRYRAALLIAGDAASSLFTKVLEEAARVHAKSLRARMLGPCDVEITAGLDWSDCEALYRGLIEYFPWEWALRVLPEVTP